jgi:hypothetical protein
MVNRCSEDLGITGVVDLYPDEYKFCIGSPDRIGDRDPYQVLLYMKTSYVGRRKEAGREVFETHLLAQFSMTKESCP